MILNKNEQAKFLESLRAEVNDIEFGKANLTLVISDNHLMYVDYSREKNKRIYFHSKPQDIEGEKNE